MEFKDKVKYVRKQLHLTQTELATQCGLDFTTINKWENGINSPQLIKSQIFFDFCKAHGIDFDEIESSTAKSKPHVEKADAELKGDFTMAKFLKQFIDCHRVSGASDEWLDGWRSAITWCKERIDEFYAEYASNKKGK